MELSYAEQGRIISRSDECDSFQDYKDEEYRVCAEAAKDVEDTKGILDQGTPNRGGQGMLDMVIGIADDEDVGKCTAWLLQNTVSTSGASSMHLDHHGDYAVLHRFEISLHSSIIACLTIRCLLTLRHELYNVLIV